MRDSVIPGKVNEDELDVLSKGIMEEVCTDREETTAGGCDCCVLPLKQPVYNN